MRDEITVDEAAAIFKISPAKVRHRMESGRLAYREKDDVCVARREDVFALVPEEEERRAFARAIGEDTDSQEADALLAEKIQAIQGAEMAATVVVRTPGLMSTARCFRATRVPVETVFQCLAAGDRLDDILDAYPTLIRADLRVAILQAGDLSAAAAPVIDPKWVAIYRRRSRRTTVSDNQISAHDPSRRWRSEYDTRVSSSR